MKGLEVVQIGGIRQLVANEMNRCGEMTKATCEKSN